ncbi:MAG: hypothetical protein AB7D00_12960, partial [Rhodospirillaceae bacterium]
MTAFSPPQDSAARSAAQCLHQRRTRMPMAAVRRWHGGWDGSVGESDRACRKRVKPEKIVPGHRPIHPRKRRKQLVGDLANVRVAGGAPPRRLPEIE